MFIIYFVIKSVVLIGKAPRKDPLWSIVRMEQVVRNIVVRVVAGNIVFDGCLRRMFRVPTEPRSSSEPQTHSPPSFLNALRQNHRLSKKTTTPPEL